MGTDRFGNPHAPNLSYVRGNILTTTEDDSASCAEPGRKLRSQASELLTEHRQPNDANKST